MLTRVKQSRNEGKQKIMEKNKRSEEKLPKTPFHKISSIFYQKL